MRKLGLSYQPFKKMRRNQNAYQPERIQDYLVGYNEILKDKAEVSLGSLSLPSKVTFTRIPS